MGLQFSLQFAFQAVLYSKENNSAASVLNKNKIQIPRLFCQVLNAVLVFVLHNWIIQNRITLN